MCARIRVEAVKVVDAAGQAVDYPDMSQREETAAVEYINKSIGINLPPAKVPPPHTQHAHAHAHARPC